MGTYVRGNNVVLVNRFYTVDPITEVSALKNPTTVVFTVDQPDGTSLAYVWGVDLNVTNPSEGLFLCELAQPLPPGYHTWRSEGAGAVVAANEGSFEILESGVIQDGVEEVAVYGPCQPWISAEEIVLACGDELTDATAYKADSAAEIGSSVMWDLSGRQFDGVCERTVRPCTDRCGCFGIGILGLGPWYWGGGYGYGLGSPLNSSGGYWFSECGDSCGCGYLPTVRLAGYPIREILEVKIGGDVVDPDTYRLDRRRELVRLSSSPGNPNFWPACQDLSLPDTAAGTFSVKYRWGAGIPELGKQAAAQLGCEVYKALNGKPCQLPSKATKIVRQGVTIDRVTGWAQMFRSGSTGLSLVDLFIAQVNPSGMKRRPAVFSPDLQQFGRGVR